MRCNAIRNRAFGLILSGAFLAAVLTPISSRADNLSLAEALDIGKSIYWQRDNIYTGTAYERLRKDGQPLHGPDVVLSELAECLKTHGYQIQINACYAAAYKQYDQVLRALYEHILSPEFSFSGTHPEQGEAFKRRIRAEQEAWAAFKDAEITAQDAYAMTGRGTVIGVVLSSNRVLFIRARIAEVVMYYGVGEG
jgi:uncharacterized protein YecT (DUF1311 family)